MAHSGTYSLLLDGGVPPKQQLRGPLLFGGVPQASNHEQKFIIKRFQKCACYGRVLVEWEGFPNGHTWETASRLLEDIGLANMRTFLHGVDNYDWWPAIVKQDDGAVWPCFPVRWDTDTTLVYSPLDNEFYKMDKDMVLNKYWVRAKILES